MDTYSQKLSKMVTVLDKIVFGSDNTAPIKIHKMKSKVNLVNFKAASYDIINDLYIIPDIDIDFNLINFEENCYPDIERIFVNNFSYAKHIENTELDDLPLSNWNNLLCSTAAHEVRHRFQYKRFPNLFKNFLDYKNDSSFQPIYVFTNDQLLKLIKKGEYTPNEYMQELDAIIIGEIFITELWLYQENGLSFWDAFEKSADIITMDSKSLKKVRNKICYLGKSYYN